MARTVAGQKFFYEVFDREPLASKIRAVVLPDATTRVNDRGIREHCRRFVKINYHPCGTTKMGHDSDPMAVLDPRMRVRGIEKLRV